MLFGALLLVPSIAAADHPMRDVMVDGDAALGGFVTEAPPAPGSMVFARQVLPPTHAPTTTTVAALAQSKIIYLNHTGVTLRPGNNDARTNTSTIVSTQVAIPAWNPGGTVWADTVSCFRDIWSRFDVTVVDVDPGNVPHIEAVFGGTPTQVGLPSNVGGVSPFTTDCSIIENSIVFTFSGVLPADARVNCEIMAQEVAHSYGLDHELLASDPMTYLQYNGNRAFQDQTVSCGESTARNCGINGSVCSANQNSVQMLISRVGIGDAVAPSLAWSLPANNAVVPPGFSVTASGSDNIAITGASVAIDGGMPITVTGAGPFMIATPTTIAEGPHMLEVTVTDGKNVKTETRNVTVMKGAPPPGSGSGSETSGDGSNDITGGCNAGGGTSLVFGLGVLLLAGRRRIRR
jgi:hypothetical protein